MPTKLQIYTVYDPRWYDETAELRAFLSEPRTWKDLNLWSHAHDAPDDWVRQALVWMDTVGLATSFYHGPGKGDPAKRSSKSVRWVQAGYLLERSRLFAAGQNPQVPVGLMEDEEWHISAPTNYLPGEPTCNLSASRLLLSRPTVEASVEPPV